MENIEIKGLENLDDKEKKIADKLFNEYYNKINRALKNFKLKIHIKIYDKEGKSKKFSINIESFSSAGFFEGSFADWNLAKTIHNVFNKIETQIEHKLHISDQHKR